MNCKNRKYFTLLELLIAVMIFLIVSVVIAMVFRTTIYSYRKGKEYTDLYQGLSGTFLVMKNDLNRIVPVPDKDYVKFENANLSFVALGKNDDGFSSLELIKYSISNNALNRNSVEYPEDKNKIDRDSVEFLNPIEGASFAYLYSKEESQTSSDSKKSNSDEAKKTPSSSGTDKKSGDKSDSEKKEKNIKLPYAVKITGNIKSGNITKNFETSLFVPIYLADKAVKAETDTGTKSDT